MTDPNDDLSSVADPGSVDPEAMGEPGTDVNDGEVGTGDDEPGTPGRAPDSPAAQGSPVGPPG